MVDYSKWKDIEISDDEDDTHPNIDTPSLFRWRHQARIERMEEREREKKEHEKKKEETLKKLQDTMKKVADLETSKSDATDLDSLKKSLQDLEKEEERIKKEEEELKKKEKFTPWNVDTISQPGFTKTVINTKLGRRDTDADLSDEENEKKMKQFIKENEKKLKEYGMFKKYDDSKRFLQDHPNLVCEHTAIYLAIWCINLELEEKHDLMNHVAHQCICMQFILELSKQLDVDPRACVGSFFSRMQNAEVEYKKSFDDELRLFKERLAKRGREKLMEVMNEVEEKDRKSRLGPGGLDPVEVFESLPEPLRKCFESEDIPLLQKTIAEMPEEEAGYHMRRCVDSGLWVPNSKSKEKDEASDDASEEASEEATETPDPE